MTPGQVVETAARHNCEGIAYTYNEPSIYMEFARDAGRIAHEKGLFNIFVSNGYGTPEGANVLQTFLDAITVDFKGNLEKKFVRRYIGIPDPEPILQYLLEIRKTQIHVEFTDLIVPGVGDNLDEARKISKWIFNNFGPDAPIHFLRFHPDYRMMDFQSTPVATLEAHCGVAREEGLRYVYIGNVPGHPLENTYCPGCGSIAIGRHGFEITSWNLDSHNRCASCSCQLPITGRLGKNYSSKRFLPVIN